MIECMPEVAIGSKLSCKQATATLANAAFYRRWHASLDAIPPLDGGWSAFGTPATVTLIAISQAAFSQIRATMHTSCCNAIMPNGGFLLPGGWK